jgi:hypothetical protein
VLNPAISSDELTVSVVETPSSSVRQNSLHSVTSLELALVNLL